MKTRIQKIYEILEKIGLSKKEIEIYLSLLELGRANVSRITQNTSINRTTGYVILNKLVHMGIVQVLGKKPKLEYIIETTDHLKKYLMKKIEQDTQSLKLLDEMLPEIKSMHRQSDKPIVKYYEGIKGIKQIYEDTLTTKEKILSMASYHEMHETLPDYFPKYYKRRAEKGIHIDVMIPNTSFARRRIHLDEEEERTTILLPYKDEYLFTPEIDIYDNKTMIVSWNEKLGITIESKEIADLFRVMFRLAWKEAERIDESKKLKKIHEKK